MLRGTRGTSRRRSRALGVTAVAVSALLVAACSSSKSTGSNAGTGGKRGGVLTIANVQGGLWTCSFNPFNNSSNFLSAGTVYEPLVYVNTLQDDKTTPWLATKYD